MENHARLLPSEFNFGIFFQLLCNSFQPRDPLFDDAHSFETGSNSTIPDVGLPSFHLIEINIRQKFPRAGNFDHIIVNRHFDILAGHGIIPMANGISNDFSDGPKGIFQWKKKAETE